jgi:hypothetical protein
LFVVAVTRQAFAATPAFVDSVASVLLLGQPFLTMQVVRRVGGARDWVCWSALGGWLVSAVLLLTAGDDPGVSVWLG